MTTFNWNTLYYIGDKLNRIKIIITLNNSDIRFFFPLKELAIRWNYFSKNIFIASLIYYSLFPFSKKITGMEKYLDAAYRGIANEDCSYAFSACPQSLGQSLLRSVGLN